MLREFKNVSQPDDATTRRWFSDSYFDLVVHYDRHGKPQSYQLCYDIKGNQHALVFERGGLVKHQKVLEESGQAGHHGRTPIFTGESKPFAASDIMNKFAQAARGLDWQIQLLIVQSLKSKYVFDASQFDLSGGSGTSGASAGSDRHLRGKSPRRRPLKIFAGAETTEMPRGKPRAVRREAALPEELVKKVRQIEITTRRVIDDVVTGQYRSHFKGYGMQFSEHRIYLPGDDVRHIDWKASARNRDPLIKKYEEERELTVLLLVDISGSSWFGTNEKLKSEVIAELGGMLAYAAALTGDKVGAILFGGEVEEVIPPKKGRQHVLRVVRSLLGHEPRSYGTDLKGALDAANRVLKHAGVVFLLSDFLAEGYELSLRRLATRHDVVAVWVNDQKEEQIPTQGVFRFYDPESGREQYVNTGSYGFRKWLREFQQNYVKGTEERLKNNRVEVLRVKTQEDYSEAVVRFFRSRARR